MASLIATAIPTALASASATVTALVLVMVTALASVTVQGTGTRPIRPYMRLVPIGGLIAAYIGGGASFTNVLRVRVSSGE